MKEGSRLNIYLFELSFSDEVSMRSSVWTWRSRAFGHDGFEYLNIFHKTLKKYEIYEFFWKCWTGPRKPLKSWKCWYIEEVWRLKYVEDIEQNRHLDFFTRQFYGQTPLPAIHLNLARCSAVTADTRGLLLVTADLLFPVDHGTRENIDLWWRRYTGTASGKIRRFESQMDHLFIHSVYEVVVC